MNKNTQAASGLILPLLALTLRTSEKTDSAKIGRNIPKSTIPMPRV